MKKQVIIALFILQCNTFPVLLSGQGSLYTPLPVPVVIQERSNWCWAACSRCVLSYVSGVDVSQCQIAEYARRRSPTGRFGWLACCQYLEPLAQTCNRTNFMYGTNGSIQDILNHFGGITASGFHRALIPTECNWEFLNNHPFIIRIIWGGREDRGHVMVFRGISFYPPAPLLSYVDWMDPQSGYQVGWYEYLVYTSGNPWTHTLVMHADKTLSGSIDQTPFFTVSPNPATDWFTIQSITLPDETYTLVLSNLLGQKLLVKKVRQEDVLAGVRFDISQFQAGSYLLTVSSEKMRAVYKVSKTTF